MKFLQKLKSSNFWVSMISAVVLILQAVFNVDIKTEYLSQIIMAMLGVLVMTGIVSDSPNSETKKDDLNINNFTKNLEQVFTQTIANMEKNMLSVITQIEKVTQSFNACENEIKEQNIYSNTASTKDEIIADITKNELQFESEKVENINNETQTLTNEQPIDKFIKVDNNEATNNENFEQSKVVEEIKTSNLNVL